MHIFFTFILLIFYDVLNTSNVHILIIIIWILAQYVKVNSLMLFFKIKV